MFDLMLTNTSFQRRVWIIRKCPQSAFIDQAGYNGVAASGSNLSNERNNDVNGGERASG
jgi:hypothetical protein